jgi:uncharacterized surface anchored protein
VQIQKTNDAGEPLGGACFTVGELAVCDNDENDANGDDGFIVVGNLPAGPVTVTETTPPPGYNIAGEPQTVELIANETVPVSFVNALIVGSVSITKTDDAGNPLGGACFVVDGRDVCDNGDGDDDGAEGTIVVSGIAVGPINVTESSAPEAYIPSGETQSIEIFENEVSPLTFVNTRRLGAVSLTKTNEAGEPLGGACFTVGEQTVCDDDENDSNGEPGIVDIANVPVGSVEISESTAPEGYAGGDPQTVEVVEGETATATFVNTLLVGNIRITKTDEAGELLGGACFTFDGQIVCDNEEGDGNDEA